MSDGSEQAERAVARQEMPDELRADVRLLGELLGQVIAEHGGQDLLDDVELLRHAVIAARRGRLTVEEVATLVEQWPLDRAVQIARAFTCYFHLANLAEEHYRIRILRERDVDADRPLPGSLADAVQHLKDELGQDRLASLTEGLELHPVLTAHPTEARRRAVVTAIQRISGRLVEYSRPLHGVHERMEAKRRLLEEIDLLWRSAQLRSTKLDPLDEVRTAMAVFDETLFRLVPAVYRSFDAALAPGSGNRAPLAPAFIRFGSWIGGDRDGNPNVVASVTREAILIQAEHILRALEAACLRIARTLTAASSMTPPSHALRTAIDEAADAHPTLVSEMATRSPQEPHRQWLLFVAARIRATRRRDMDLAYRSPAGLLTDLALAQDSLTEAGAARQAFGELQHLIWQVETFGFHLAELEVRQHSTVHAEALAEVRAGGPLSERTEEVLATFRVVSWIQERFGVEACSRYVVSFTRSAGDVEAVYELAAYACTRPPVLDVVPLFESGNDLDNSVSVLEGMLALPPVQARLAKNGRRMEVMLGYSDSAKELGPAAATLRLYDAQAALTAFAAQHDIRLTLFHGRGGALGRGGGPANRAVLAQAPGSVAGRFKVTEQGEVIFARYGHAAIARRHMEQVVSAVLSASTPSVEARTASAALLFRGIAAQVAEASEATYRKLVQAPGFAEWFAKVSPLGEIGTLRLGSRPARRGLGAPTSLDDLRAIPWVFAWAQTRVNLPGWYGLGSGLAAVALNGTGDTPVEGDSGDMPGLAQLQAAYQEWPLFASLLDNVEMSLAKTDRAIAARYLALGNQEGFTEQVLGEYDLTKRLVLAVTGHERLLQNRRVLSRAVQLRDPYVDALSHLQLRALAALRTGTTDPDESDRLSTLLLLTVNGVAAGLQNTG
ncbi:phosphoenolpyruvate carboxylase [Rhizohabitans arisaemae]|uniref:phosphoenolpyruvate carboxylase n=1 Tax=Rhizohabitans arisaemae TaxID=2720610 RepID=UPI0024B0A188|nr:phosphoenolpyruvate carboxylase [Rhizohabitans arisaemae]